jgi:hypothetical protein
MARHWSDDVIDDIVGAFKIFAVSAVVIFGTLAVAKSLYPSFPLDNNSYGVVAVILGLFLSLINYIKVKAKL